MEGLIDQGSDYYAVKKYEHALKEFTRAMNLCPCTRGMKRKRCSCKDFESVASKDGSIFNEAMCACECDVGKTFNKCDNPLHIKALDYRAATFEAMKELGRAKKDAEWMLELAPRLPDGYLRLGKVVRLQKNTEFAWKIYSAGINANKDKAMSSSQKLQKLYDARQPLQLRFRRKDPMCLPFEIVHLIFSRLDIVELTRCLHVSRTWKRTLEVRGNSNLWTSLIFLHHARLQPPSNFALQKLLTRAGRDVRHIVIEDPSRFQLNQQKLTTLLLGSRNLQRLELGPATDFYWLFPKGPGLYKDLRHVSMDSYNNLEHRGWHLQGRGVGYGPIDFIKSIAGTLERLELVGVPTSWCQRQDVVDFPNLKVLRLEHKSVPQVSFPIFVMASKTPRLEQLCLKNVHIDNHQLHEWKDIWDTLWNHLKVLVFFMPDSGPVAQSHNTLAAVTLLTSLNFGNDFQHIDLEVPWTNDGGPVTDEVFTDTADLSRYGLMDAVGDPILRRDQFQNMRTIRLKAFSHVPAKMRRIFDETVRNGKLHTFDIVFPLQSFEGPMGQQDVEHLKGYDWLRGHESIRCLGMSRFRFKEYPRSDDDLPLPNFLASFPNLETLSLSSEEYSPEEFCTVIEAIMKVMRHLKTIYQDRVNGALMDQLQKLAEGYGVQVIWGERPREWPVPLDE
ncbi:hypothetical protein TOPH_08677 [Tolypocladium ophioglossoides CBS 100239]|uniref:F-box domain-containing protein n=1 Tax=Tolypocladium ophioglossoides (strain CBS 100239) TaxID=1163406 RepID=A0A0L0MY02_TOLOC|nr:hypothetical protein TOPH_08677 [Tolypocladium ophioglossoides CBS 100239]